MNLQEIMAGILAAPDEEGPRLVYADYLQERGDPRGELIQLQCELEHLPVDGAPRRMAIKKREAELMKENEGAWIPVFTPPNSALLLGLKFRRGFIEEACVRFAHMTGDLGALFAVTPFVRRLIVKGPEEGEGTREGYRHRAFTAMARFPQLLQTTMLELRDPKLDDLDVTVLADIPTLAGVQCLKVVRHGVQDPGIMQLCRSKHLRLRELVMPRGEIGDVGAQCVFESEVCARATHLDLSLNPLGESGRRALADWFERNAEKGWWALAAEKTLYRRIEESPFVIGHSPLCQLVLREPRVGREHMALWAQPDGSWRVEAIEGNECSIHGKPFKTYPLVDHEYRLKSETIRFRRR